MTPIDVALAAMTYLLVKHTVADYMLQSAYQWKNKGRYGHPGGILHALIHVVMSAPLFLILPAASLKVMLAILATEFVIHYHVDWSKETINKLGGLTQTSNKFWWMFGIDQLMHGLTYVAMVAVAYDPARTAAVGRLIEPYIGV